MADEKVMVDLHTVKRVLALDLGMDARAIESCLENLAVTDVRGTGPTAIPLAEALRIVALAETSVRS